MRATIRSRAYEITLTWSSPLADTKHALPSPLLVAQ
jgi:hypothetical protein